MRAPQAETGPAVSVLLPVRDGAAHLPAAIDSLEAQVLRDFEVIAVDDGSTDATPEILARWAGRDARVRVLAQPRRGIARALDAALSACRAPLVARMDADDVALPRRLSAQRDAMLADPSIAALGTRVEIVSPGERTEGMRRYEAWLSSLTTHEEILADLFVESPLVHPSVMARRQALVEAGGYRDVDGPEDYDLWLRLAARGARLANLPEVLLLWADRPDRATRIDPRYRSLAITRLKARHLVRWRLGHAHEFGVWGAGRFGKQWARLLGRRGLSLRLFVDIDPRKVGQSIHGAQVIRPDDVPQPGGLPLVVAVGAEGARDQIRGFLRSRGYREPEHFVCVQ